MINIKFSDTRIEIKGHAGYAERGKDIVCAAISSLFFTFVISTDAVISQFENGIKIAETTPTPENKIICDAIKKGCEMISNNYPGYVSVRCTLPKRYREDV